jgi:hypothetical protein
MDMLSLIVAILTVIKLRASEGTKSFSFSVFPGIVVQLHVFCMCLWLNGQSEFVRLTQTPPLREILGLLVGRSVDFAGFTGLNESKLDKKFCFAKAPTFERQERTSLTSRSKNWNNRSHNMNS